LAGKIGMTLIPLADLIEAANVAFDLPPKPLYGQPCNGCGHCCFSEQCPTSIAIFGQRGLCPAIITKPGRVSCGLMATPEQFVGPDLGPAVGRFMMLTQGVGFGCDALVNDEDDALEIAETPRREALAKALSADVALAVAEIERLGGGLS
jgi:hypothetical protein